MQHVAEEQNTFFAPKSDSKSQNCKWTNVNSDKQNLKTKFLFEKKKHFLASKTKKSTKQSDTLVKSESLI